MEFKLLPSDPSSPLGMWSHSTSFCRPWMGDELCTTLSGTSSEVEKMVNGKLTPTNRSPGMSARNPQGH